MSKFRSTIDLFFDTEADREDFDKEVKKLLKKYDKKKVNGKVSKHKCHHDEQNPQPCEKYEEEKHGNGGDWEW